MSPPPFARDVTIELLLASPLHRYAGRPSDGPRDPHGSELLDSVRVRAHLGIVGDRYFAKPAHRTASVTVMSAESLEHVASVLGRDHIDPADPRRNIIVRGLDIDSMRDELFSLDTGSGPVLFRVNRPANPCAWMDVTMGAGAHKAMRGRGGMRCEPLSSGTLALGPAVARTERALAELALF